MTSDKCTNGGASRDFVRRGLKTFSGFLQNSKLFIIQYLKVYREILSFSTDQLIDVYRNTKFTQVALFLLLIFLVAVILEAIVSKDYVATLVLIFIFLVVVNLINRFVSS